MPNRHRMEWYHEDGRREVQESAPYVSVEWMRNYLQRVRRSAATVLDKELAMQVGATGNNWTQLLRAAHELGLVDEDGRPTQDIGMALAAGGARAGQAARLVVERTYPSLVARLREPLSNEDLKLHFYDVTRQERGRPLGESARRQAVALFRFWVEQTGDRAWLASLGAGHAVPSKEAEAARTPRRPSRKPPQIVRPEPEPTEPPETFRQAVEEQMPFYRATISVPAGRPLSADEWEFVKQSLSAKIEFLKARSTRKEAA